MFKPKPKDDADPTLEFLNEARADLRRSSGSDAEKYSWYFVLLDLTVRTAADEMALLRAPPESIFTMTAPSHMLLNSDGTVIRVWPGSYKDKPVRERMARQILADTSVVLDTLNAVSSRDEKPQ